MLLSATKISQSNHSLVSQNRVLNKTKEMKAQRTMTDTNRFKATAMALPCVLNTWPNGVVACTLPKRL
jgi:hypothetical protein